MQIRNVATGYYDPKNVTLLLGGIEPVDYAEDTAIEISKEQDRILPKVGVDGAVAIARNRNEVGMITISLKNTSRTNRSLINFYAQEETGIPWFDVSFVDPSSGVVLQTQGWIETQPTLSMAQEIMQMDWVIGVANISYEVSQDAQEQGVVVEAVFRGVIT